MQIIESQNIRCGHRGLRAGGGMATKILADASWKWPSLKRDRLFDPADPKQRTQLKWPYKSPVVEPVPAMILGSSAWPGGWKLTASPTIKLAIPNSIGSVRAHVGRPHQPFKEFPAVWSQRLQGKDRDGLGENWPIGYDDIKPYYDKVDKLIGVFGGNEGRYNDRMDSFARPSPDRTSCTTSKALRNRMWT